MDPWHDYLVFPLGPLLLAAQLAVITSQPWRTAAAASAGFVAGFGVLAVVLVSVTEEADANIGLALLLPQLAVSIVMLLAALVRRRDATG